MRLCQPHWDALKAEVHRQGLGTLIAESGEEVAQRMVREMEDGPSVDTFDPLMSATFAIMGNAVRLGGPGIIAQDGCPICVLNEHHKNTCVEDGCLLDRDHAFDGWIERAVTDTVEEWKARGS